MIRVLVDLVFSRGWEKIFFLKGNVLKVCFGIELNFIFVLLIEVLKSKLSYFKEFWELGKLCLIFVCNFKYVIFYGCVIDRLAFFRLIFLMDGEKY